MDWRQVAEAAQAEIESLEIEREAIDKKIADRKKAKLVAERLANESNYPNAIGDKLIFDIESFGMTDSCRDVLRSSGKWMSPLAVRAALQEKGLDLSKQKNAMASIHAVLKRLKLKEAVLSKTGMDGGTVYKWRGRPHRIRHSAHFLKLAKIPAGSGLPENSSEKGVSDVPSTIKTSS